MISVYQVHVGSSPNPSVLATTLDMGPCKVGVWNGHASVPSEQTRSSLFSSPKRSHQEKVQSRVVLLSRSDHHSCDGASLMSTHTRTCSCFASNVFQICGRQTTYCSTPWVIGSRKPVVWCQHFVPDGDGSCVVSCLRPMPESHAASASGIWRSLTSRILRTLFAKPLRLLTIIDLLLLNVSFTFLNSSCSSRATLQMERVTSSSMFATDMVKSPAGSCAG